MGELDFFGAVIPEEHDGDGTVWTLGYNAFSQLVDGTTTDRNTPVDVTFVTYADFEGYGSYKWDCNSWSQLNTVVAADMVASH